MKKVLNILQSRIFLTALAVLIQIGWVILFVYGFSIQSSIANLFVRIISYIAVIVVLNKWINPSYKLAWTVVILAVPVLGVVLYLLFGRKSLTHGARERLNQVNHETCGHLYQNMDILEEIEDQDVHVRNQSYYIEKHSGYPIYTHTSTNYYACGEEMFPSMLEDMKEARDYIFLEFFIIGIGKMWNEVLALLQAKVKEGVRVRVIYDDVGSVNTLPAKYYAVLQKMGIECVAFHPLRPAMSIIMNNRDHRKILVIDGKIGYTGGVNLSDEYINEKVRFGYWKDTGVRLEGDAVWSMTSMFLENWNYANHTLENFKIYRPKWTPQEDVKTDGYVQPYGDSPLTDEGIGENIYMNLISKAKKYVYIFTPYLLIDNEMLTTLCNAAKTGIDVRIMMPGIPDKKIVYYMAQFGYMRLLDAGIKIYHYTPGFLHAKCFVCDDEIATVGSINLDYRSLYLHFECGVWMYQSKAVAQLKEDFIRSMEISEEITIGYCMRRPKLVRVFLSVLNVFSPLL